MGIISSLTNRAYEGARGKVFDVGEGLSRKFTRAKNGTKGFLYGNGGYDQARRSAKTWIGRNVVEQKRFKDDLKRISTSSHHIAAFDADKLSVIYQRYLRKNRKSLERKWHAVISEYAADLGDFASAYEDFLETANTELVSTAQAKADENREIESMVIQLKDKVEKLRRPAFPNKILDITLATLEDVEREKARMTRKAYKEDVREQRTGKVKMGIFGGAIRLMGGYYLVHKLKKFTQKFKHEESSEILGNLKEIHQQIDSGEIKVTVLQNLVFHYEHIEKIDEIFKDVAHDVRMMMGMVEEDYHRVSAQVAQVLTAFANEKALQESNIAEKFQALEQAQKDMKKVLETDELDQKRLMKQIRKVTKELRGAFAELKNVSHEIRDEARKDPVKFMERVSESTGAELTSAA